MYQEIKFYTEKSILADHNDCIQHILLLMYIYTKL